MASLRLERGCCFNNTLKDRGPLAWFDRNSGAIICVKPPKAHTSDTWISSTENVPLCSKNPSLRVITEAGELQRNFPPKPLLRGSAIAEAAKKYHSSLLQNLRGVGGAGGGGEGGEVKSLLETFEIIVFVLSGLY